jgi:hypothetical protein
MHDSVVLPVRPVNVTIPTTRTTVTRKIRVRVRNADPTTQTTPVPVQLAIASDCGPGVVVGAPDFYPLTATTEDTVLLAGGRSKAAIVVISVDSTAVATHNSKAPYRCHLTFTSTIGVAGNTDPTMPNSVVGTELNIVDRHDVSVVVHESVVKSIRPMTVRIAKTALAPVKKRARPTVVNADVETTSDSITLVVTGTDCPAGIVGDLDFDPLTPALDTAALLAGRRSKRATLPLTFDAGTLTTPNALSPIRCTVTLGATGPTNPEIAPAQDPTNNTTTLVIDVVDKHDVP